MDWKAFIKKNRHLRERMLPKVKISPVHEVINERQGFAKLFQKHAKMGEIGVLVNGMDCDCTQFSYGTVWEVKNLQELIKRFHEAYEWADGPLNISFCSPEKAKKVERVSRDLALEAFEDGHPHVVYL